VRRERCAVEGELRLGVANEVVKPEIRAAGVIRS
jgi:hypothetical protein